MCLLTIIETEAALNPDWEFQWKTSDEFNGRLAYYLSELKAQDMNELGIVYVFKAPLARKIRQIGELYEALKKGNPDCFRSNLADTVSEDDGVIIVRHNVRKGWDAACKPSKIYFEDEVMVKPQYRSCTLMLQGQSEWENGDRVRNNVWPWEQSELPDLIRERKEALNQARKWREEDVKLFQCSGSQTKKPDLLALGVIEQTEDVDNPMAIELEVQHFIQLAQMHKYCFEDDKLGLQQAGMFHFFSPVSQWCHYKYPSRIDIRTPGPTQSWPNGTQICSAIPWERLSKKPAVKDTDKNLLFLWPIAPGSDSSIWFGPTPRHLAEIYSKGCDDETRVILQAAYLVRVINLQRKSREFCLAISYIDKYYKGISNFMFQVDKEEDKVYYTTEIFDLREDDLRFFFVTRLYNIAEGKHLSDDESLPEAKEGLAKAYQESCPARTIISRKRKADPDAASGPKSPKKLKGGQDNKNSSYPDDMITDRYKLKPVVGQPGIFHIDDPCSSTVFFGKKVLRGSQELLIYNFLDELRKGPYDPASDHFLPLHTTLIWEESNCIVLSLLPSVGEELRKPKGGILQGRGAAISSGLMEGVHYLHKHHIAHLDLKPDNLVISPDMVVKIIDFDVSLIIPDDQNGELAICAEDVGTEGYKAPEVSLGKYSPYKADRYSVGRCLMELMSIASDSEIQALEEVAKKLTAMVPEDRPPLYLDIPTRPSGFSPPWYNHTYNKGTESVIVVC